MVSEHSHGLDISFCRLRSREAIPSRLISAGRFSVARVACSSPSLSRSHASVSSQVRIYADLCTAIRTPRRIRLLLQPPRLASSPVWKLLRSDAPSGSLFTSARVVYAAARTGQLPEALGVLDTDRGTPIRAVLLQAAITIALILLGGGFRALVRIAVVALWAFYFLTVRRTVSQYMPQSIEYHV